MHRGIIARTAAWCRRRLGHVWTRIIDDSLDLSGKVELYDMRNDPREERNVAGEAKHRELAAEMKREMTRVRGEHPAPVTIAGMAMPAYATVSEKERKELRESAPGNQA
jgi:hypothetical protein